MRRFFCSIQLVVCGSCTLLLGACSKDSAGSSQGEATPAPSTLEVRATKASAGEPVQAPAAVQTQRQPATNAAPLNLEIGFATLAGARAALDSRLDEIGRNEYTEGPMFEVDASSIGVKGLKRAVLIFDREEVLQGTVLTFAKDPKGMFELLRKKYSVESDRIDRFMNKGTARLRKGHSWVEIDAPHLSFEMEVRYLDKDFTALVEKRQAERHADEQQRKVDQL